MGWAILLLLTFISLLFVITNVFNRKTNDITIFIKITPTLPRENSNHDHLYST